MTAVTSRTLRRKHNGNFILSTTALLPQISSLCIPDKLPRLSDRIRSRHHEMYVRHQDWGTGKTCSIDHWLHEA